MPVLVDSDPTRAASLMAALPLGTQVVPGVEQLDSWMAKKTDEYVVVLGPDVELEAATILADRMSFTRPSTALVLVREKLSAEVFASAMQAGIRSVVAEADTDGLGLAVERARQTWEAINGPSTTTSANRGKVITIFSPKGGVGKTTMTVNLALALAADGKRVCVLDLDLAFGDVAITLQLIPEHTISEAVEVEEHLDFSMLETLLTHHEGSLWILAAPTQPDAKDRIPPSLVRRVIQTLRSNFDYLVIDTSPSFDDQVLQAFDETDECVLVATLDVPTVKNMKMAIETLDMLNLVRDRRHLVLNRADEEVGLSAANVESILNMPVAETMPTAVAVANATNHGRPIILAKPDHPVSKAVRALATRLAGDAVPGRPLAKGAPAAKRGFFGRKKK
jgi:pilus assembly protein CpaE